MLLTISFLHNSSHVYAEGVGLAQRLRYAAFGEKKAMRHEVEWHFGDNATDLARFIEVWHLVSGWKGSRFEIDGVPILGRGRWNLEEMLHCMGRAATFDLPQRYCWNAPALRSQMWADLPAMPCRLLSERDTGYAVNRVHWDDPNRRLDELRSILSEHGLDRCPYLKLDGLERGLAGWIPIRPWPHAGSGTQP